MHPPETICKGSGPRAQAYDFIKKETLVQIFSSEFCEIFKNSLFTEHLWATVLIYTTKVKFSDFLVFWFYLLET